MKTLTNDDIESLLRIILKLLCKIDDQIVDIEIDNLKKEIYTSCGHRQVGGEILEDKELDRYRTIIRKLEGISKLQKDKHVKNNLHNVGDVDTFYKFNLKDQEVKND